jgi:arylsulfatase A-like enzyme
VKKRPNILLVVMDCARFDYLSAYGYPRPTTPHLERLAAGGVLFENAFAAAPWTPPSHASLFTGTYPSRHGVDVNENLFLSEQNRTLAEILADQGYRTFGVLPDVHLSNVRGFHKGFQDYNELWRIPYLYPEYDWLKCLVWNILCGRDRRTRYTNTIMKRWLKANYSETEPFFIFVNYKAAHNSYHHIPWMFRRKFETKAPGIDMKKVTYYSAKGGYSYMARQLELTNEEFRLVQSWYAGAVAYLDSRIGEMVQYLKTLGAYENTLIVITADHGENLGEHHLAYHLFCLYDTLLHVPLLMSCPALLPHGRRVPGLVSLTDVVPTILEVLELEENLDTQGTSLVPFDGRTYHEQIFAEFGRPHYMLKRLPERFPGHDFSAFDKGLQCIRTKDHKLIVGTDGAEELYDLQADPGETTNRISELSDVAARLHSELSTWRAAMGPTLVGQRVEEDAALVKSLRDLGYF